ncbi:BON domain-containing protein [Nitrogeniibacter aestuarii]|uniref:BON domain-containing protein n=1 Tax=Nitrogeniibacter aestuarii TaxID=2815343 RepID=UPI001D12CABD|nr:BON domain-containing protein [Nitrogeniibacter aestuarii]
MKFTKRNIAIATLSATTILLAACSNDDNMTAGEQLDKTIAETKQEMQEAKVDAKQAANEAEMKASEAADEAGDKVAATTQDVKEGAKELWSDTKAAANNAGEAVSESLADAGQAVEDTAITTKVKARIIDSEVLDGMDIDVTTKEGVVMLEGVVTTTEMRELAGKLAMGVEGVKSVKNEIVLKS